MSHQHQYSPSPGRNSPELATTSGGYFDDVDAQVICVNVGGTFFTTQLGTLRSHKGSNLCTMFTHPFPIHQDARDGSFFIDRNGSVFGLILDYLRTGTLVVPRDPVQYATIRREVRFYGLPVALQLPATRPLSWQTAPTRYRHARIVIDELEKTVEWEEGSLPQDLHQRTVFDMVRFFTGRGYRVASEYTSRGTKGFMSIWLIKAEAFPGADVAMEITNEDVAAAMLAAQQAASSVNARQQQQPPTGSANPYNKQSMPPPSMTSANLPRPGSQPSMSTSNTPRQYVPQSGATPPMGGTPRATPNPQGSGAGSGGSGGGGGYYAAPNRTPTGTPNAPGTGGQPPTYAQPNRY